MSQKIGRVFLVLSIIMALLFFAWFGARLHKELNFYKNGIQHLENAVEANNIEFAKEELSKMITYLENNNLTEGVVSIFFHQQKNNLGNWYKNMTGLYDELEEISTNATILEKENALLNLKESLTHKINSKAFVTVPKGVSIYPDNVLYFVWGILSLVLCTLFWVLFMLSTIKREKV